MGTPSAKATGTMQKSLPSYTFEATEGPHLIPYHPHKCQVCNRALTVHQAVAGFCEDARCRDASIRATAARRSEADRVAMHKAAQTWLKHVDKPNHALIVLPGKDTNLVDTPMLLAGGIVEHIRELLADQGPAELESDPVSDRDNQAEPHRALSVACATCRGHCCRLGGSRAFIDARTMVRVRSEHPELDDDAIVARYQTSIPTQHVDGSCVFHGPNGCTLTREFRSQICNEFYCAPIRQWFVSEGTKPGPSAVAVVSNGQVIRSALIEGDTAERREFAATELPSP